MDDSISLIACYGQTGIGETLLSTVAAIQQTISSNTQYEGISISRPVVGVGKEMGFCQNPWRSR